MNRSYRTILLAAGLALFSFVAASTYFALPSLASAFSHDPVVAFFGYTDASPAWFAGSFSDFALIDGLARSLMFAAVAVSALMISALFARSLSASARSEVRASPGSIATAV